MTRNRMPMLRLVLAVAIWLLPLAVSAQTTLILAHSNKNDRQDNPTAAMAVTFKEVVEAKSGGKVKVEIFPENQLGSDTQAVALVRKGVIQMAISSFGGMVSLYPLLSAMDFPFAYADVAQAYQVLDGPFGQKLRSDMETRTGLAVLGFADTGGLFVITNSKRQIRSPADMASLRIRTMPAPTHRQLVKSLGGEPVTIPWNNTFDALQTGLADGQMNPISTTRYGRLHVIQKYMTVTNHAYIPFLWTANREFLNTLSAEDQAAVMAGIEAGTLASRAMAVTATGKALEALFPALQITALSAKERDAFRQATQPAARAFVAESLGAEGIRLLDDFLAAVAAIRPKS